MTFGVERSRWLVKTLAPHRPTHVVDVGANPIETVPYKDLMKNGGCRVTGFEPQKAAFEKLLKIKGPNETYHQFELMNAEASGNQLIDSDAVYIRDLKDPDNYSDEDLKHLAILSDGVWFSFDLTLRCIDMLVKRKAIEKITARRFWERLPHTVKVNNGDDII